LPVAVTLMALALVGVAVAAFVVHDPPGHAVASPTTTLRAVETAAHQGPFNV